MEFSILGPIEASRSGGPKVVLDGAKQQTVLAALLLARERILSDDRLSALLWGEHPPTTSSAQIYTYISRLRKYLGNEVSILRQSPGYVLKLGWSQLDLARFEQLAEISARELAEGRSAEAAKHAGAALALWRGPALANSTEYLGAAELPRLEEARMAVLETRIEADLARGRHLQLIPELTGLVAEQPLREQLRVHQMIALYRSGRQADALSVFHEARAVLGEELGVDPGVALSETYQAILVRSPALQFRPERPARVRAGDRGAGGGACPPAMLPPDVPVFVGREQQLEQLRPRSRPPGPGCSVCTPSAPEPVAYLISGLAGIGKSALAIHAAHACAAAFPDGQLYADLGGTGDGGPVDPSEVLLGFLRALGMDDPPVTGGLDERGQLYRSRLADRRMLILLDNAVDERQVRPLLPGGGGCRVLVTSRRTLAAIDGVQLPGVDPLDAAESMTMLTGIIGARRVLREPDEAARILRACAGLPLAVRAVAARLVAKRHWNLSAAAGRLGDDATRLDGLASGDLDVRAAIVRCVQGTPEAQCAAFCALGSAGLTSFPASAAAEMLCLDEDTAEGILESLVDVGLLSVESVDRQGRPCYRLHELFMLVARQCAASERVC